MASGIKREGSTRETVRIAVILTAGEPMGKCSKVR
jgi:hypothetical protein